MHLGKVVIISFLLLGCDAIGPHGCGPSGVQETQREATTLEYYKDTRTNLCFVRNVVTNSNGFSDNVFANVPCTPEVEKLINQK